MGPGILVATECLVQKDQKRIGPTEAFMVGPEDGRVTLYGYSIPGYLRLLYTMPDSSNIQRCIPCTVQESLKVRRLDDAEAEEAVTIR